MINILSYPVRETQKVTSFNESKTQNFKTCYYMKIAWETAQSLKQVPVRDRFYHTRMNRKAQSGLLKSNLTLLRKLSALQEIQGMLSGFLVQTTSLGKGFAEPRDQAVQCLARKGPKTNDREHQGLAAPQGKGSRKRRITARQAESSLVRVQTHGT